MITITASTLKLIAMGTMLIDHIGVLLFPEIALFRIIGRLSFPLYAYLIGEGCRYTRSKKKYFLNVLLLFFSFQLVHFLVRGEIRISVLFGFLLSIIFSSLFEWSKKGKGVRKIIPFFFFLIFFSLTILFSVDYSVFSFLLPISVFLIEDKKKRLAVFGFLLLILGSIYMYQYFCLFSLLFLLFYKGEKGKKINKKIFYWFYPLHYAVLGIIGYLINL